MIIHLLTHSGMAHFITGSHGLICYPNVYPKVERSSRHIERAEGVILRQVTVISHIKVHKMLFDIPRLHAAKSLELLLFSAPDM